MKSVLALLMLAAALFVGACNSQPGESGVPTLNPIGSPEMSPEVPTTSPETLPSELPSELPSASPAS